MYISIKKAFCILLLDTPHLNIILNTTSTILLSIAPYGRLERRTRLSSGRRPTGPQASAEKFTGIKDRLIGGKKCSRNMART